MRLNHNKIICIKLVHLLYLLIVISLMVSLDLLQTNVKLNNVLL